MENSSPTEKLKSAGRSSRWNDVSALYRALTESQDPEVHALAYQAAVQQRDLAQAITIAERITHQWPDNPSAWQNLAHAHGLQGDKPSAMLALRQALACSDSVAPAVLLQLADIAEQQGASVLADRAAALLMVHFPELRNAYQNHQSAPGARAASLRANEILRDRHFDQLAECIKDLESNHGEKLERMHAFARGFLGKEKIEYPHPLQRPSHLYVPGLTAKPWWERDEVPWVKDVEEKFDEIFEELQTVLADDEGITPYIDASEKTPDDLSDIAGKMSWSAYHFYRHGRPLTEHIERCPRTLDVVHTMPLMTQQSHGAECLFSIVRPHSKIPAHVGHSNVKLGVHFPLLVPPDCGFKVGGETRHWTPGECLIFDDGFVHEVWNNSDQARVVLIFDMWHPELSDAERLALDKLTALTESIREERQAMTREKLLNAFD